jgi:hypothetical protein
VSAEFACATLLSVIWQLPDVIAIEAQRLGKAASAPGKGILDRTDFGVWETLGTTLTKIVRRVSTDEQHRSAWEAASGPAAELIEAITSKQFWDNIHEARLIRNQKPHRGIVTAQRLRIWRGGLESLLVSLFTCLQGSFDTCELVQPDTARFQGGVFTYKRARRLVGPNDIFEELDIRTLTRLEADSLVFVDRYREPARALPIAPLIRVDTSTSTTKNACYFLNSRNDDDGKYSFVSYHFEDEPDIERSDPMLDALVQVLSTAVD